jgi:hypothetical protein
LSAIDALLVLLYKVGEITSFPAAQQCGSDWVFAPQPASGANVQVISPGLGSGNCQPGIIYWTPPLSHADGEDFTAALFGDCSGNWLPPTTGLQPSVRNDANLIRIGRARADRRRKTAIYSRLRIPLSIVSSQDVHALDLTLHYDPERITPVSAQPTHRAQQALVAMHVREPGVLALSLASSAALQPGTVLMLQFESRTRSTHPTLQVSAATVSGN